MLIKYPVIYTHYTPHVLCSALVDKQTIISGKLEIVKFKVIFKLIIIDSMNYLLVTI